MTVVIFHGKQNVRLIYFAIFVMMSKLLPYPHLSDEDLALLLHRGDRAAYTEIYNRYWAMLFRHARRMLQNDDEAQDIVQDTFAGLWISATETIFQTSLSAYLYTAVRNKIINLWNRDKIKNNYLASLESFIDQGMPVTDDLILERELVRMIEREVALLPEKMREAFELSRKSHLSYKEISENMGISENTVRKHISKALKILRNRIKLISYVAITVHLVHFLLK